MHVTRAASYAAGSGPGPMAEPFVSTIPYRLFCGFVPDLGGLVSAELANGPMHIRPGAGRRFNLPVTTIVVTDGLSAGCLFDRSLPLSRCQRGGMTKPN
jgi:hypothetical protein